MESSHTTFYLNNATTNTEHMYNLFFSLVSKTHQFHFLNSLRKGKMVGGECDSESCNHLKKMGLFPNTINNNNNNNNISIIIIIIITLIINIIKL